MADIVEKLLQESATEIAEATEAGRVQGAKSERERIIQKLRARVTKHHPVLTMDINDLEALIKGEQK